ncbi:primosomal protein N' [soil metagenome]
MTGDAPELDLPGLVRDRAKEGRAKAAATRARRQADAEITSDRGVARVLVDTGLAHLDRPFDYAVPVAMAQTAQPGVRVKVRFAGKERDGFVLERRDDSEHDQLRPIGRVVSGEVVLTPDVARLCEAVANRYAGPMWDVVRLAVPPRHAAVEAEDPRGSTPIDALSPDPAAWTGHEPGPALISHLAAGGSPRAVWHAAAGTDWPDLLAVAAAATVASGRGVLICVPDARDVSRVAAALSDRVGADQVVELTAGVGPAARYRTFLSLSRGERRIVVGTRSACFAPVADLGLVAIWDDGDEVFAEQRSPYPHAREVLVTRAEECGAAAIISGFTTTVESRHLVDSGWAPLIAPTRQFARARVQVGITGATEHDLAKDPLARTTRTPAEAHGLIRTALAEGPVLVQVPRRGYAAALVCGGCRGPVRCENCAGPLRVGGPGEPATCAWCGHTQIWVCPNCASASLRAPVIGDARTAEELGRSFPGVRVATSSGERVMARAPRGPAIVVATPGAEPVGEYAAVIVLDTWLLLGTEDLRCGEEALRRWSNAIGLVRPGGRALAVGDPAAPELQSLVRWSQPAYAAAEAEARRAAHLPPASRMASITGPAGAVADALVLLDLPPGGEVLGPVPSGDHQRMVVRVPRLHGPALSAALLQMQRLRAARKRESVRVQVDPSL